MRFPGVVTKNLTKGEPVSFLPFDRQSSQYLGFIIESQRKLMLTLLLDTPDSENDIGVSDRQVLTGEYALTVKEIELFSVRFKINPFILVLLLIIGLHVRPRDDHPNNLFDSG
jgi:hypothetical protein